MNLYRRRSFQASLLLSLACIVASGSLLLAQRRKAHKLRATALVEVTTDSAGNSKNVVIPIAILDEGVFHDASIYKASPRPMALQDGVVYEVQKTGVPSGYLTVSKASREKAWTAIASWQAARAPEPAPVAASPTPAPSDDRPILRRPGSTPTPTPQAAASPAGPPTPTPPPDPDRPVLRRPGSASTPAPAPVPQATKTATPVDLDRPIIRRGSGEQAKGGLLQTMPSPGPHGLLAVSDDQPIDTRSFDFPWKPGEKAEVDGKMVRLALAQLPKEKPALTAASLKNVDVRGFDLDLTNDAVLVLTAEVPGPVTTQGQPVTRYITVIARMDFDGNPQRVAVSVADSSRLDVAPRLELIDAVDVDGDGAAELVFRQYDFDQKSFVIYSVGRTSVSKVFEGAGMPLK
jgi:hypothetical protein